MPSTRSLFCPKELESIFVTEVQVYFHTHMCILSCDFDDSQCFLPALGAQDCLLSMYSNLWSWALNELRFHRARGCGQFLVRNKLEHASATNIKLAFAVLQLENSDTELCFCENSIVALHRSSQLYPQPSKAFPLLMTSTPLPQVGFPLF